MDDLTSTYTELRNHLLAYLRKRTGDAQAAEDLFQDVMLKALMQSNSGKMPENLTGWLFTVARNAAIDYQRGLKSTEELPLNIVESEPDEDLLALEELANCLRPMADRLPPRYRDTVIASEFEGSALKDIAAASGLTLSAVKSRASRGRRMLQDELVKCCGVVLSGRGKVLDYDQKATQSCTVQSTGMACQEANTCGGEQK